MTIKLIEESDGTLNSENFELDLMITRPNTRTTSCGMNVDSMDDLKGGFELFEKYGCKSIGLTSWLPDTNICFKELPYINKVKVLRFDFNAKNPSLNLLSNLGKPPESLIELKLLSEYSTKFDQFHLLNNLKILNIRYFKDALGWLEHEKIIDLTILKIKEEDLTSLAKMKSLKRLKIIQGSLRSLDGIENLSELETLHVYGLKNLTSLNAMLKSSSLKNLIFESYSKNTDWNFLIEMQQLQQLNLTISSSIKFTLKLPNLIGLHSQKILDKDRTPELVVQKRSQELNLIGLPLPGFKALVDSLK